MVQVVMMKCKCNPLKMGGSFTTTNTVGFSWWLSTSSKNAWNTNLGTVGFFRSAVNGGNAESETIWWRDKNL